ncbi:dTDP-glucose 4,6-dehydratase [Leptospira kobayashii]|uniref:dTDP-glucose 4,6-dehydratase n=1 Tax=Leptospira kobayashii TaxID=1917830 RepID=A0ABM7UNB1_9LEPT|nr:dTDP-glucose 4,6-dehydratase [Leptospira kobayashii]
MEKIKALITGGTGFVGKYLVSSLNQSGEYDISLFSADIRDKEETERVVFSTKPSVVFHLAAQPFVPRAIEDPWETEEINVRGTLNLLESLHRLGTPVRMLYVSSADVYGFQKEETLPLSETLIPKPINPYSGSKLAAESYCRQYSAYDKNLTAVIARPFNHIGIGQRLEFVIPNFCKQIIQAKIEERSFIEVGDLSPTRDFSHVQDIVDGYMTLVKKGEGGEIYNICSGKETSIRYMVEELIRISGVQLEYRVDPNRVRSSETSRVFGNNDKLVKLGWTPKCNLPETLKEIYSSMENDKTLFNR